MGNAPTSQPTCLHEQVSCLNQYELIRKYRCNACGGVMMCACNENFGRRFLVHQLTMGRELNTQTDVPVDLGFVPDTCPRMPRSATGFRPHRRKLWTHIQDQALLLA